MGICETEKCCFCVAPQTGVVLIGYFKMVLSLIGLFTVLLTLTDIEKHIPKAREPHIRSIPIAKGFKHKPETSPPSSAYENYIVTVTKIALYVSLVLFLCSGVMATILIVGVHKKNYKLLRLYWMMCLSYDLIFTCMEIILVIFARPKTIKVVITILLCVLDLYFLFVVRMSAMQIKIEDEKLLPSRNLPFANNNFTSTFSEKIPLQSLIPTKRVRISEDVEEITLGESKTDYEPTPSTSTQEEIPQPPNYMSISADK